MASAPPNAVAGELLRELTASPDAYPQNLDLIRDAVLLVRLNAAGYRAASFLDDRILGPAVQGAWLPAKLVADAAASKLQRERERAARRGAACRESRSNSTTRFASG